MDELEITHVLRFVLETMKEQALYMRRQQGWLAALWETFASDAELESRLKQHPLYDQGPQPDFDRIQSSIPYIDELVQRLKEKL